MTLWNSAESRRDFLAHAGGGAGAIALAALDHTVHAGKRS
jgi:hypothetical protein